MCPKCKCESVIILCKNNVDCEHDNSSLQSNVMKHTVYSNAFTLTNFITRLNEGHTVFVERKIASRMHDEQFRHFAALGGLKDLFYQVIFPTRCCLA